MNPICRLCGERPVQREIEGRILLCQPCAEDPEIAAHAARDWR